MVAPPPKAFPDLRPLAVRILQLPPSAAGGERSFKVSNRTLTRLRSRLSPDKADMHKHSAFTWAQLNRPDILRAYRRTCVELDLLFKLGLAPADASYGKAAAPAGEVVHVGPLGGGAIDKEGGSTCVFGGGRAVEGPLRVEVGTLGVIWRGGEVRTPQ